MFICYYHFISKKLDLISDFDWSFHASDEPSPFPPPPAPASGSSSFFGSPLSLLLSAGGLALAFSVLAADAFEPS